MIIAWSELNPVVIGIITFFLMWSDWFLSILQEKERQSHYSDHYQSYPINTIEGNPAFQSDVGKAKLFGVNHFIISIILSSAVGFATIFIGAAYQELFLGFVWGIFLIVGSTHLGNIFGYKASRRGLHGKLYLHQRTGLLIQAGRYAALTVLLVILAVLSVSQLIVGVAFAGFISTLRQFLWLRKVPEISAEDIAPEQTADNTV